MDLASLLKKKLWNMKVISLIAGALGTVLKGVDKRLQELEDIGMEYEIKKSVMLIMY